MHEAIMQFPSDWFYHGELEAAPEVRYRGILDFDTPMNWIDTSEMDFHEEFVGESFRTYQQRGSKPTLTGTGSVYQPNRQGTDIGRAD